MPRLGWLIAIACLAPDRATAAGQESPAPLPRAIVEPAAPAAGEPAGAPATPGPPASMPGPSPEAEITLDKGTQVTVGIGLGGPISAALSFRVLHGLGAKVIEPDGRVKAVCAVPIAYCARGFLVQVDAGSGGGKLSLGIGARAHVDEESFHGTVGVGLRAALVRTWGSPIGTEPGLTYLGPELDLKVIRFNLTLGVLWRVSGSAGSFAVFGWGLGFGL
jgi:hypothetical protein